MDSENLPTELIMSILQICLDDVPVTTEIAEEKKYQKMISSFIVLNKKWRNFIIQQVKRQNNSDNRCDIMLLKALYDAVKCSNKRGANKKLENGFKVWYRETTACVEIGRLPDYRCLKSRSKIENLVKSFIKKLGTNYTIYLHSKKSKSNYQKLDQAAFDFNSRSICILFADLVTSFEHELNVIVKDDQLQFLPINYLTNNLITQLTIDIDEGKWAREIHSNSINDIDQVLNFYGNGFSYFQSLTPDLKILTLFRENGIIEETLFVNVLQIFYSQILVNCKIGCLIIKTLKFYPSGEEEIELEEAKRVYIPWFEEILEKMNLFAVNLDFYPYYKDFDVDNYLEYKHKIGEVEVTFTFFKEKQENT